VFLIGKSLNSYQHQLGATKIRVTSIGYWVSEHTLKEIAASILQEHSRTAGQAPPNDIALILIPYDDSSGPERWSAETIGENVVLAMGRRAAEKALAARLQVALDHEFFHLWIPNGIRLRGDYDWFFEGFTLYQALLAGVRLKHLHFDDYLETLARVYASYLSATERDKLSLLEASERRWTTSSSLVYDKGMLVAFIYDLMLRRNSNGRESLPSIYPLLLREAAAGGQDANELIMRLLDGRVGMQGFSTQYVQAQSEIDLSGLVGDFGIQVVNFGSSPQIKVKKPLTKEQRLLLKTLGYKG
jgi:predicted metalloprotease with PDZ domain